MEVRLLTSPAELGVYNAWVKSHPEGSLWQSLEWKRFQEALGRDVRIYAAMENDQIAASALVVIDRTSFGLSTWEIPRGPLMSEKLKVKSEKLLEQIMQDAKKERCLSLYLSPSTDQFFTFHFSLFTASGRHVYPEATRVIDLTLNDDALLAQMKPKGRYNIRLAEKHGVRVEASPDIDAFSALMKETADRDGFRPSGARTYLRFLEQLPQSFLLLAFQPPENNEKRPAEGLKDSAKSGEPQRPVAGLLGVIWGSTGIYYYGGSSKAHRELMAPYLLQWEAIRYCRDHGCTSYDLFGIAPEGTPDHPWASVSEFKAKFGGNVLTHPPEQEIILRPLTKALLTLKRRILG